MAAITSPLQETILKYENALNALNQCKNKYDFSPFTALLTLSQLQAAQIDPQSQTALANRGFFFATKTFEKVFTKDVRIEKIKNLALISALLVLNPEIANRIFPGIQLTQFQTKEGLAKLQADLESRVDYQTFRKTEWTEYQNLKATKKLLKEDLVSLIQKEHISTASLNQHTQNKKIIRLGIKEETQY